RPQRQNLRIGYGPLGVRIWSPGRTTSRPTHRTRKSGWSCPGVTSNSNSSRLIGGGLTLERGGLILVVIGGLVSVLGVQPVVSLQSSSIILAIIPNFRRFSVKNLQWRGFINFMTTHGPVHVRKRRDGCFQTRE